MEKTLIIIKPDAICKKLIGKVISRFEKEGFKILACRMEFLPKKRIEEFYTEHKGKDFYEPLVKFMSSNPVVLMVVERENAVKLVRDIVGKTDPKEAVEGTLRKLYASDNRHNILHTADSLSSAKREIDFFFSPEEIHSWQEKIYKK